MSKDEPYFKVCIIFFPREVGLSPDRTFTPASPVYNY